MSKEDLQESLEELKAEIESLAGERQEDRERLVRLIQDVEDRIDEEIPTKEEDEPLTIDSLRHFAEKLEVEHPTITKTLNRIMNTLSNMGI